MAATLFQMELCLNTVGFTVQNDRDKLHGEGLTDLEQLKSFTNKDIHGMAITLQTNLLSVILATSDIPLSYVIREVAEPEDGKVVYNDFMEECVARHPLE